MSSPVEHIKERLTITDVVGGYVELQRAGKNLKACCPFHSERTPSFFVSPERDTYYCFGCGAKGDIFSFVEAFEGLDFRGALQLLADRAGVELKAEDPEQRSKRERLYALLAHATEFFAKTIQDTPHARAYLEEKRGVTKESMARWQIGYAPAAWHETATHLRDKGYTDAELEAAGITKTRDTKTYDVFRGRLMFPIADAAGRAVAFSGRDMDSHGGNPDSIPKYVNSPETELYTKSNILFGFHLAKQSIRKHNFAIIAEGQLDVILSHQAGFPNTVGLSGTALTHNQLTHLSRLSNNVVFAFDTDAAGIAASARSALRALALGMDVKIADLPEGIDPADVISESGRDRWREAIRNATHVIDATFARTAATAKDDRQFRRAVSTDVLPLVAAIPNRLDQSHFIKSIAGKLGVTDDVLANEIATHTPEVTLHAPEEAGATHPQPDSHMPHPLRREQLKRLLLGIILWQETKESADIDTAAIRTAFAEAIGTETFDAFCEEMKPEYEELRFQAEQHTGSVRDISPYIDELICDIRKELLREEYAEAMKKLREAEANNADATALRQRCQTLLRELGSMHTGG